MVRCIFSVTGNEHPLKNEVHVRYIRVAFRASIPYPCGLHYVQRDFQAIINVLLTCIMQWFLVIVQLDAQILFNVFIYL